MIIIDQKEGDKSCALRLLHRRAESITRVDIILASRSPRRKELLRKVISEFRVLPSTVDERYLEERDPVRFASKAAIAKAKDIGGQHPYSLVIAADTVVCLGEEILGKPKNYEDAKAMLEKLSGKKHSVITAIAVYREGENRLLTAWATSYVAFRRLSQADIEDYLKKGDYLDKAGSYAIQEVGDSFVESLGGDYDNVVGLPLKTVKRLLKEFFQPEHVVSISDIAFPNDWGVGMIGGLVTFVPGAVFGDEVRIKVSKTKKKHCFGTIVKTEKPSPFRTEPRCPHFNDCGGCSFQNLAYEKQLELKQNYLLRTLQKIGNIAPDEIEREEIIPSPSAFFYRNKMEFAFGGSPQRIFLGLRSRTTPLAKYEKKTVALQKCLIFSPAVEKIFPLVNDYARATGLPPFDPLIKQGFFRNLALREAKNTGEIMAILVTRSGKDLDLAGLSARLKGAVPQLESFLWAEHDGVSDVIILNRKQLISGRAWVEETLGGLRFRVHPESFFQPNPGAAEVLYSRITREASHLGSRRILGLYCGTGSIELFLAKAAEEVAGIDSEAMNILTAEENLRMNDIQNCRFIHGRVENALREHTLEGYDLLVVDPPRAGISDKGMRRILALDIPRIIYVSCNPAAFARDVSLLSEKGYRLQKLCCIDFFPHTPHVEAMGVLVR